MSVPPVADGSCDEGRERSARWQTGAPASAGGACITSGCAAALPLLGEIDERGLHPPADVAGLAQPELEEDRVDVLLDRALRQHELVGDRLVAVPARDVGQHLHL